MQWDKVKNVLIVILAAVNVFLLANLGIRIGQEQERKAALEDSVRTLAAEYGGAVWDQYAIMGGSRSSALWKGKKLMRPDRIHFTAEGYRLVGDLLYNALITDYLETNGN